MDTIVTNAGTASVSIFFGHGNGHFDNPVNIAIPAGSQPGTIAIADINEDGDPHLVMDRFGFLNPCMSEPTAISIHP